MKNTDLNPFSPNIFETNGSQKKIKSKDMNTQKVADRNIDFLYKDCNFGKEFKFLKIAIFFTRVCSRPILPNEESKVITVKPKKKRPAS
tara:strand:- start:19 stop:285 length:267 start_codon:yes stop_codon:yes gene_type:complete